MKKRLLIILAVFNCVLSPKRLSLPDDPNCVQTRVSRTKDGRYCVTYRNEDTGDEKNLILTPEDMVCRQYITTYNLIPCANVEVRIFIDEHNERTASVPRCMPFDLLLEFLKNAASSVDPDKYSKDKFNDPRWNCVMHIRGAMHLPCGNPERIMKIPRDSQIAISTFTSREFKFTVKLSDTTYTLNATMPEVLSRNELKNPRVLTYR